MLVKACKTLGYDFLQNCLLDVGVCLVLQYGTKLYQMLLQSDRKDSYISGMGLNYVAGMIIRTVFSMEKHSCVCLLIEMRLQIEDRIFSILLHR